MARIETYRVRYQAKGPHTRRFGETGKALSFVGKLEKGDFLGLTHNVIQPVHVPGMTADITTGEEYIVRFLALGIRTRTFDRATAAVEFIGKLPAGDFLALTNVVETDVSPRNVRVPERGEGPRARRPLVELDTASVPSLPDFIPGRLA
jgi:hypothetical protein